MEYAYAALLLAETGEELNERNLRAVLETANCAVSESRVKALVAALEGVDVDRVGPGTVGEADLESAPSASDDTDPDDGHESTDGSAETPAEAIAEPDGGDATSGASSDESG